MVDIARLYHPAYSNALRAGATLLARIDGRIERIVAKPLPLSAMPDGNDIALHYHQVGQERLRAMKRWFEQAEDDDPLSAWASQPAVKRLSFASLHLNDVKSE